MKVQILGSGCDKCRKLTANVQEAAVKLGVECEIEKVTEIDRITGFGVMMTPALVIDGKVVSVGKVLSPDEAAVFLKPRKICCCKTSTDEANVNGNSCCCSDESGNNSCCCSTDSEVSGCCCGPQKTTTCGCEGTWNAKKILTALLLLFVVSSVGYTIFREIKRGGLDGKSGTANIVPAKSDVLIVYYFHRTQRCPTCNSIENLTRTAVTNKYPKEVAQGSVVFKSLNIDIPENEHVIKDFELASGTVVLQKNGKYAKLDRVWPLAHQPEKLMEYIQEETAKMMGTRK